MTTPTSTNIAFEQRKLNECLLPNNGYAAFVILFIRAGGSSQSSKPLQDPKTAVGLGTDA